MANQTGGLTNQLCDVILCSAHTSHGLWNFPLYRSTNFHPHSNCVWVYLILNEYSCTLTSHINLLTWYMATKICTSCSDCEWDYPCRWRPVGVQPGVGGATRVLWLGLYLHYTTTHWPVHYNLHHWVSKVQSRAGSSHLHCHCSELWGDSEWHSKWTTTCVLGT